MDRADPAWVAGTPGLQQIERLGTRHLTDRDAVGPQPQRGTNEIRQRCDAVLGAQCDEVGRLALELAGILDEHDAVSCVGRMP
jgi:hypothetical protein